LLAISAGSVAVPTFPVFHTFGLYHGSRARPQWRGKAGGPTT
jgi:hypothetical protein